MYIIKSDGKYLMAYTVNEGIEPIWTEDLENAHWYENIQDARRDQGDMRIEEASCIVEYEKEKLMSCPYCYDGLTARSSELDPDAELWEYECDVCSGTGWVSESKVKKEEEYIRFYKEAMKELNRS